MRPALPAGWGEFKQPDGAFSVYLPGAPQPGATVNDLLQPVPAGRALLAQYKCQGPGWLCDVGVMIYSPELVDGVKSASESRPLPSGLTRTAVTWVGHPATEIVSDDSTKKVEIQRRMWIGNRAYHCNVWGWEPGRPTASELATLFDSFSPAK